MKVRTLIDSFNDAIEGILYTLKTQRNMRIHFFMAVAVLVSSLFVNLSKLEVLILFFTIALVIVAEMINTAIESTIDLITKEYHDLAKIAKNVAAGAVLVAAINAIVVAYMIFFNNVHQATEMVVMKVRKTSMHTTFITLLIVVIIVVSIKAYIGKGTPLRGGMPSGHAAIAFAIFCITLFLSKNALIHSLCFFMAVLVAQSRVEGGIHTVTQILLGAILGILVTILMFGIIG